MTSKQDMIRRLVYDGNNQRAIELLLDLLEEKDKEIKKCKEEIKCIQSSLNLSN